MLSAQGVLEIVQRAIGGIYLDVERLNQAEIILRGSAVQEWQWAKTQVKDVLDGLSTRCWEVYERRWYWRTKSSSLTKLREY